MHEHLLNELWVRSVWVRVGFEGCCWNLECLAVDETLEQNARSVGEDWDCN